MLGAELGDRFCSKTASQRTNIFYLELSHGKLVFYAYGGEIGPDSFKRGQSYIIDSIMSSFNLLTSSLERFSQGSGHSLIWDCGRFVGGWGPSTAASTVTIGADTSRAVQAVDALGEGIVGGLIVGGAKLVRDAVIGASAGTAAAPGPGTVAGGVGGAILGFVSGFVIGFGYGLATNQAMSNPGTQEGDIAYSYTYPNGRTSTVFVRDGRVVGHTTEFVSTEAQYAAIGITGNYKQ